MIALWIAFVGCMTMAVATGTGSEGGSRRVHLDGSGSGHWEYVTQVFTLNVDVNVMQVLGPGIQNRFSWGKVMDEWMNAKGAKGYTLAWMDPLRDAVVLVVMERWVTE